ncbi:MAG: hypothetical protein K8R17_08570, partial [Methanosarcinales archaeon]|nr:hypothetical protein [Methanosarcinales archaeon]
HAPFLEEGERVIALSYSAKRVFLEGKVLFTKDLYYILTLSKETEMEYVRYEHLKRDYHKAVMNRVRAKLR